MNVRFDESQNSLVQWKSEMVSMSEKLSVRHLVDLHELGENHWMQRVDKEGKMFSKHWLVTKGFNEFIVLTMVKSFVANIAYIYSDSSSDFNSMWYGSWNCSWKRMCMWYTH